MKSVYAALALLALTGCAQSTLAPNEYGKAAMCRWDGNTPYLCQYNPDRVTVDQHTFEDILQELENYRTDELKRRAL